MMPLGKGLQGRSPVKIFSRSGVQQMDNGIRLPLDVAWQVGALGQILQQPIGLFVGAAGTGNPPGTPEWRGAEV
jgi:hypothetical protein